MSSKCTLKPYADKLNAQNDALRLTRSSRHKKDAVQKQYRPSYCSECNAWHAVEAPDKRGSHKSRENHEFVYATT